MNLIPTLKNIKDAILRARSALVACHVDPDPDTIGSMIAMALALKAKGIKTVMYSSDDIPETYRFLPHTAEIMRGLDPKARFDIAVALDAGDIRRVGSGLNIKQMAKTMINIDHHTDNTLFGDINLVRGVSSSAELVYALCKYLKVRITKDMAISLYTAIMTDTGCFRYENTTADTFMIAAELLKLGVIPNEIATKIYETKPIASLKVLALALQRIRVDAGGKIVWTSVTRDMVKSARAQKEELPGIVDHLRSIKGSEIAILFREEKGGIIKVNLRSRRSVNVQKIARLLGGGGHPRAAGITIAGKLRQVESKVLQVVRNHVK